MSVHSPETTAPQMRSCPHLGVQNDPGTCLGYPAEWNLCYRARPAAAVSLVQQRERCLSPVFMGCAVYQRKRKAPLPRELRGARAGMPWKWAWLAVLLVLAVLAVWAIAQARFLSAV